MIPTYGFAKGPQRGSIACFGYAREGAIIQLLGRATRVFAVAFYRTFAKQVLKA